MCVVHKLGFCLSLFLQSPSVFLKAPSRLNICNHSYIYLYIFSGRGRERDGRGWGKRNGNGNSGSSGFWCQGAELKSRETNKERELEREMERVRESDKGECGTRWRGDYCGVTSWWWFRILSFYLPHKQKKTTICPANTKEICALYNHFWILNVSRWRRSQRPLPPLT